LDESVLERSKISNSAMPHCINTCFNTYIGLAAACRTCHANEWPKCDARTAAAFTRLSFVVDEWRLPPFIDRHPHAVEDFDLPNRAADR
jgi:hypothetical protein